MSARYDQRSARWCAATTSSRGPRRSRRSASRIGSARSAVSKSPPQADRGGAVRADARARLRGHEPGRRGARGAHDAESLALLLQGQGRDPELLLRGSDRADHDRARGAREHAARAAPGAVADFFFGGKLLDKNDLAITLEFFGLAVHDKGLHATKTQFDHMVKAWLAHTFAELGCARGALGGGRRRVRLRAHRGALDVRVLRRAPWLPARPRAASRFTPQPGGDDRPRRGPVMKLLLVPPDALHRTCPTTSRSKHPSVWVDIDSRAVRSRQGARACTTSSWTSSSSRPRSASTASA